MNKEIEVINIQLDELAGRAGVLLLDGLDEVVEERLPLVHKIISDALNRFGWSTVIITCRSNDYLNDSARRINGLDTILLGDFDKDAIHEFITRWYRELVRTGRRSESEAKAKSQNLQNALTERRELLDLAKTPLLLALIALVHTEEGELPPARALLYQRCIRLLLSRWRPANEFNTALEEGRLLTLAVELGYFAHNQEQRQGEEFRGLARAQIRDVAIQFFERAAQGEENKRKAELQGIQAAQRLINSNGLLLATGGDNYSFAHRTFQEFLAGQYLGAGSRFKLALEHSRSGHWRVALCLMAGYGAREGNLDHVLRLIESLIQTDQSNLFLAADLLLEIGREPLRDKGYDDVLEEDGLWYRTSKKLSARAFRSNRELTPLDRNRYAEKTEELEADQRSSLCLDHSDYWTLRIWPGDFFVGEGRKTFIGRIEQSFSLARYPVTNKQYAFFLADIPPEQASSHLPSTWRNKTYEAVKGNHPVTGVNWESASAFANWVNQYLQEKGALGPHEIVRLPTELEWERAASYPVEFSSDEMTCKKTKYPWGDHIAERVYANTLGAEIRGTSVVGIFPKGAASCGAEDLIGNTWEWCSTPYFPYKFRGQAPIYGTQSGEFVYSARGGSWRTPLDVIHNAFRNYEISDGDAEMFGFRLVKIYDIQQGV